jgi:hypothetical protein
MRRLFVTIPGAPLTQRLVRELMSEGVPEQNMRLLAHRPEQLTGLPVVVSGFHPPLTTVALRALAGMVVALMGGFLVSAFSAIGSSPGLWLLLLTVALAGATAGAATGFFRGYSAELRPLRGELRGEDVVMLLDLPDERLAETEQTIKNRHPEIRVKGTDPAGSPPFP